MAMEERRRQWARDCEALYVFIVDFKAMNDGQTPTHEEMAKAINKDKGSYLALRLKKLQEMGLIWIHPGQRHITVIGGEWSLNPILFKKGHALVMPSAGVTAARNIAAAYGDGNE